MWPGVTRTTLGASVSLPVKWGTLVSSQVHFCSELRNRDKKPERKLKRNKSESAQRKYSSKQKYKILYLTGKGGRVPKYFFSATVNTRLEKEWKVYHALWMWIRPVQHESTLPCSCLLKQCSLTLNKCSLKISSKINQPLMKGPFPHNKPPRNTTQGCIPLWEMREKGVKRRRIRTNIGCCLALPRGGHKQHLSKLF